MGRSQVLYNRTKGRYKNRHQQQQAQAGGALAAQAGRGAGPSGMTNTQSNTQDSNNKPNPAGHRRPNWQPASTLTQGNKANPSGGGGVAASSGNNPPTNTAATGTRRRPKLDESILLAAPPSQYPKNKHTTIEDEGSMFVGGGFIDIPGMAATLTSVLTLSQRLRIPRHVAHQLVDGREEPVNAVQDELGENSNPNSPMSTSIKSGLTDDNAEPASPEEPMQPYISPQSKASTAHGATSPVLETTGTAGGDGFSIRDAILPDDTSFSVDQNRLRVGPDGQVEVRPKSGVHYRPAVSPLAIPESNTSLSEDDHTSDGDTPPSPVQVKADVASHQRSLLQVDRFDENSASDDEEESFSGAMRQMDSFDSGQDDLQDRYLVNYPERGYEDYEGRTAEASPSANLLGKGNLQTKKEPPNPAAAEQKSRSPRTAGTTVTPKRGNRAPTPEPRPVPKPQKTRPPVQETESYLDDWLDRAMQSTEQPQQPSLLQQSQARKPTLPPRKYIHSGQHLPPNYLPPQAREPMIESLSSVSDTVSTITRSIASVQSSKCYTVDSRGNLFDDDVSSLPIGQQMGESPEPNMGKKNTRSEKPKEKGRSGEDLDAWLDSVIS